MLIDLEKLIERKEIVNSAISGQSVERMEIGQAQFLALIAIAERLDRIAEIFERLYTPIWNGQEMDATLQTPSENDE